MIVFGIMIFIVVIFLIVIRVCRSGHTRMESSTSISSGGDLEDFIHEQEAYDFHYDCGDR